MDDSCNREEDSRILENAAELVIPGFAEETDHAAVLWGALIHASKSAYVRGEMKPLRGI